MNELERFAQEVAANIKGLGEDRDVQALSRIWVREVTRHRYSLNFTWMGRPIIQTPQDMIALQEIMWRTRPDVVIETGIAHGGSLVYHASLLELLGGNGRVVGVDVEIRAHNRAEIEKHPMARRITLIEGSSVDPAVVARVTREIAAGQRVMVILDSNHTLEHVERELELYSPLVSAGCYLVVFDTLLEDMPADLQGGRPWGPGNGPKTAVHRFLRNNQRFEIDKSIEHKLLITVAPDGYLRCIGD
jgi:cephalosporin hydroxylase